MFDKHKKPVSPRMNEPELSSNPGPLGSPSAPVTGKAAVIGPGITIDGDISGTENLIIEGKVKGRIDLGSNEVTIGQSGEIHADVTARLIRVSGKVKGDLTGKEKVVISSTGNVRGNIVAPRMLLEDGAIFKGSIDMDPGEPAVAKPAKPAVQPASQAASSAASSQKPGGSADLSSGSDKNGPDLALKSG